ncbi:hypothetical protein [Peribacillus frigoritolerans]|uniref:hypothetical protein n=1 Tax=Peribacillus frigoritolerans TaxID=450367 RepID=UPI002882F589|nr:hypothetical protein [Peribacillus frigoritolerans]
MQSIFERCLEIRITVLEEGYSVGAELLASRDPGGACFDAAWQAVGGKGADF